MVRPIASSTSLRQVSLEHGPVSNQEKMSTLVDKSKRKLLNHGTLERALSGSSIPIHENTERLFVPTPKIPDFPTQAKKPSFTFMELQHLDYLEREGFVSLADKLRLNRGYPWNQIRNIRQPTIADQLANLYLLTKHFNLPQDEIEKIMQFSFTITSALTDSAAEHDENHMTEMQIEVERTLGQLTYLINNNPTNAVELINNKPIEEALQAIRFNFYNAIDVVFDRINKLQLAHQRTQLQEADIAEHVQLPREIATILFTDDGVINHGIIDIVSETFIPESPVNHFVNLAYGLNILKHSPKLRDDFTKVQAPDPKNMVAGHIIRATMDLRARTTITSLKTKQTILAGLLSHLRQNNDGSCFATSVAIELLSSHLHYCFRDFVQLMKEGKLTRTINNVQRDIPPILKLRDDNLHRKVTLDKYGRLLENNEPKGKLWEAPGIKSVCSALGINECDLAVKAAIKNSARRNRFGERTFEIREVIKQLCLLSLNGEHNRHRLRHQMELACFIYSSQTNPPLPKALENVLGTMAEAQECSIIKAKINQSILYGIQHRFMELKLKPSLPIEKILIAIQDALTKRIRLHYDPAIETSNVEGHLINEGGFVLYDKSRRIDTEEKFSEFVSHIILSTYQKLTSEKLQPKIKKEYMRIFDIILDLPHHPAFLWNILKKYDSANRLLDQRKTKLETLKFTPWVTKVGNNSKKVLAIYLESDNPIRTSHMITGDAQKRLTQLIRMGQMMSPEEKQAYLANPHKLIQFRIPEHHTGSLMLGHASMAISWMQTASPEEWITRHVLQPGQAVANHKIDEHLREKIISKMSNEILPNYMSMEYIQHFLKMISRIFKGCSISEFRKKILEYAQRVNMSNILPLDLIGRQIDQTIAQHLPKELKQMFKKSVVHIADTNWNEGLNDMHLAFCVNPGTGKLEVWEATADNSLLRPLDQKHWMVKDAWEVFGFSGDLVQDDRAMIA